jgi:tricorn protease
MPRCLVTVLVLPAILGAGPMRGYYRFPAIHESTIVFTAEGDLWKVGYSGGAATRLTTHLGQETHAAISPDGSTIAFSAEYEGAAEVYTLPMEGGRPSRLTFDGETAKVIGWRGDNRVVYTTRHFSTLPNAQLVAVNLKTREREIVPLSQASDGSWKPTDGTLFFTRFRKQGSTTKRYKGGWVERIWKFKQGMKEARLLTAKYTGTSRNPMWFAGRVYFTSDRDGTMNLWSMTENGKKLAQHTFHKGFDVLSPSMFAGKIGYQLGADLHIYNVTTKNDALIPITLTSDFDQTRERWVKKPADYLSSTAISPDGSKAALTSRGRVFVVPTKGGRLAQVTRNPGVRYRAARFLPGGESLVALSDATGEMEFWKLPTNGIGKPTAITRGGSIFRYAAVVSPDGKHFVYSDKNRQLWIVETATGKQTRIAASQYGGWSDHGNFSGLTWSPDSAWLAYVDAAANTVDRVFLCNMQTKRTRPVTTDRFDSFSPAWSRDGKWLYILSDRNFVSRVRSPWGARQPEPYFTNKTRVYHIALQKTLRSPFAPQDELQETKPETNSNAKPASGATKVTIEFDGIFARIRRVPVPSGNYGSLALNGKQLFWIATEDSAKRGRDLQTLTIGNKSKKVITLVSGVSRYDLSADGNKIMVGKSNNLYVIDAGAKPPSSLTSNKIDLTKWTFPIQPREEWRQMFVDAWRMERDYFYDQKMHGRDWQEILDWHLPLVDRVTDRAELNDLIEQVVGELEALHTYVRGGDAREGTDKISPASLGGIVKRDEKRGGYRITHIYETDPDVPESISPLREAQPPLNVGDVIRAVNGVPALSVAHLNVLLRNQSGKQLHVQVQRKGNDEPGTTIITPISQTAASSLRYSAWEFSRRRRVEKTSQDKVGYVHLRAMGSSNIAEWTRHFYPVYNRQGLIIDVRNNRGGNIDSWILGRLLRKAWFYWQPRVGEPFWNMQYAFRGHIVVLCNEATASDGEAFTEGFKRLKLGTVIGTRTWGGEIWLSMNNRLVDKGIASAAQTGVYGPERKWLIEGYGVDPDITVENLPHATFEGKDAQLDRAVKLLLEKIKKNPVPVPKPPAYPRKR